MQISTNTLLSCTLLKIFFLKISISEKLLNTIFTHSNLAKVCNVTVILYLKKTIYKKHLTLITK